MTNLEVKVSITKLLEYSDFLEDEIDKRTRIKLIGSFCEYLKRLYITMVEESMNSNRYKGRWDPRDEIGYINYLGVIPKKGILSILADALEVKKMGYNFYIRVNPRKKYPGSKLTVLKVLRALENGTSDFSARPILYKVSKEIRSNLLDLWRGWLKMKGII